jgi:hypothetical protein
MHIVGEILEKNTFENAAKTYAPNNYVNLYPKK